MAVGRMRAMHMADLWPSLHHGRSCAIDNSSQLVEIMLLIFKSEKIHCKNFASVDKHGICVLHTVAAIHCRRLHR